MSNGTNHRRSFDASYNVKQSKEQRLTTKYSKIIQSVRVIAVNTRLL